MRWPADHPVHHDAALSRWADGAQELCPSAEVRQVLRHLPGRRVATLVDTPSGPAVLKVFARPRARGNDRRLRRLATCPSAGALVPHPLGADAAGHVSLVEFVPGEVFDTVDDERFVAVAPLVGAALAALHASRVELDRSWIWQQEVTLLRDRPAPVTAALVEGIVEETAHLATEPVAVAHRDCHPRQIVLTADGVRWIDLDDLALAPPTLDVGNMIAHLRRDAAFGDRSAAATAAAIAGFREGYGAVSGDLGAWERLALIRLAGLAQTRHGRPDRAAAVVAMLGERVS